MTMQWYYDNNTDFKDYVDRVARCRHLPVDEVLEHVITKEYLKMILADERIKKC